ncbi:MAG: hypothetical protein KKC68_08905 [Candidatus Thermoplasmatota archaeon]|nr:hypothetical protein [Candidatus Thermoplasmatota archaeon]MBU1941879.1 hypothetical protein [Candidatus Thermoplasmatota archaeon]
MKKLLSIKTLVIGCILILLTATTAPMLASTTPKQTQQTNTMTFTIYECNSKNIIKNQQTVPMEQGKNLLENLLNSQITQENYYIKMDEKLTLLKENNIISTQTAESVANTLNTHQKIMQKRISVPTQGKYIDTANIINLLFFGIKGERTLKIGEILLRQFPFLNGSIAAKFTFIHSFEGNGSIFSLGLLGFKYSYGYNKTAYPEYPHFPGIIGGNIAFTGILIDVQAEEPGLAGHYFIGVGMTFVTLWNKIQ